MSKYQGGMIGSVANATSGTAYTGRANGVFPLPQQIVAKSSSLWAIGQTRPNPPTIGTATGTGATTISVAFIPPVQNGGSAITSYTVTSSGGQTATGSSSPIVVSGLTTGTSYTFTVTATNALGTSDSSGTSNSAQAAITDPSFSSVSLLLNGDTLTDLSSSPKTVTAYGNAQISTAVKKYGTGSMYFDGAGDYLNTPASAAFAFGSGSFTVELWYYPVSVTSSWPFVWSNGNGYPTNCVSINDRHAQHNTVFSSTLGNYQPNNDTALNGTTVVTNNRWYHLALVRNGNSISLYVNGVAEATITYAGSLDGGSSEQSIVGGGTSAFCNGYIDDLRITKGVARYTSNFTPPTAALPTF